LIASASTPRPVPALVETTTLSIFTSFEPSTFLKFKETAAAAVITAPVSKRL
jgi:hypothetical protein